MVKAIEDLGRYIDIRDAWAVVSKRMPFCFPGEDFEFGFPTPRGFDPKAHYEEEAKKHKEKRSSRQTASEPVTYTPAAPPLEG